MSPRIAVALLAILIGPVAAVHAAIGSPDGRARLTERLRPEPYTPPTWAEFHAEYGERFVALPPEADIIRFERWSDWSWSWGFDVWFRLPATRGPDEWISRIRSDSPIPASHEQLEVEYRDGTGLYVVKYAFAD